MYCISEIARPFFNLSATALYFYQTEVEGLRLEIIINGSI